MFYDMIQATLFFVRGVLRKERTLSLTKSAAFASTPTTHNACDAAWNCYDPAVSTSATVFPVDCTDFSPSVNCTL